MLFCEPLFEIFHCLLIHLLLHIGESIAVHSFHDIICLPAAACHDVLIRDPGRVQDAGGVVPKIMHPEVGEVLALQDARHAVRKGHRRAFGDNIAKSSTDRLDYV